MKLLHTIEQPSVPLTHAIRANQSPGCTPGASFHRFARHVLKNSILVVLLIALTPIISGCTSTPINVTTSAPTFNIIDFGALPDGSTNSTSSIQRALDACANNGGGTVLIPPGRYVTGTLWLHSNLTLQLDSGATLLGSQSMSDFPEWQSKWEGPNVKPRRAALLSGENLENVTLTGRGVIDARGQIWWDLQHKAPKGTEVLRPLLFRLVDSRNIRIDGLTFRNYPMWTISPLACDNLTINAITIENPPDSPNTDGINPDSCSNVHISNCQINVGDDCITLKSGKETDGRQKLKPTENVTITNCTLLRGHGGVVFGSETSGSIRNVTISNCVFIGTDRGLRFKSRRGRGGVVEDIRANNLIMDSVLCPIAINLFYDAGAKGEKKVTDDSSANFPADATTPQFRRLRFSNITARNIKYAAAYMLGLPEMHVDDISIENSSFYLDPAATEPGPPDMSPTIPKLLRAGLIARRINHLTLSHVDVSNQLGQAISIDDSNSLTLSDLTLLTPQDHTPLISLQNISSAWIRGCTTPPNTSTALHITGLHTSSIRLGENDFSRARHPIDTDATVPPNAVATGKNAD